MKRTYGLLLATLAAAGYSGMGWAQGVEPTLQAPNPAQAAGQQASTNLGPISMGETGVPVREPWRPTQVVTYPASPPPPPPAPPVVAPPPPPPPLPAPPPPLPPRRDRG